MKKILKGLTFKIFIIIFISFIVIAGVGFKKDYERYVKDVVVSEQMRNRDQKIKELTGKAFDKVAGYWSVTEDKFKKDYSLMSGDGYVGLMDNDMKISQFKSMGIDSPTLKIENNKKGYYIALNKLSKQQIEKIKNKVLENRNIEISCSGDIEPLPMFTNKNTYREEVTYDEIYRIIPSYLVVDKEIYLGEKESNDVISGKISYLDTENEIIDLAFLEDDKDIKDEVIDISYKKELIDHILENNFKDVEWNIDIDYNMNPYLENQNFDKIIKNHLFFHRIDGTYVNSKGNACIIIVSYLSGTRVGPNYLVEFYPIEDFVFNNIKAVFENNLVDYLVFIFFMILLALLISYMITKRIKKIDKVTCMIADNDFNVKLSEKGEDELSSLSKHINTMSKNLKQNIEELNNEIEQVKKLENLRKEFVAKFTHEIKTPLAIINGNLELLQVSEDIRKKEHYIEVINTSIEKINSLILQMLDLSKLEAHAVELNKTEFVLEDLVMDIIDNNESLLFEKHLKVKLNVEKEVILNADKDRLGEVIHNYFINAIKHSKKETMITINITEKELSVYNIGEKISEDIIDDIWLSFVSTSQNGTGLGLAIAKNILELHKYQYGVRNQKDGVEFYFQY